MKVTWIEAVHKSKEGMGIKEYTYHDEKNMIKKQRDV